MVIRAGHSPGHPSSSGALTATVSIATVAPSNTIAQSTPWMPPVVIPTVAAILGLFLLRCVSRRRRLSLAMLLVALVAAISSTVLGCTSPSALGSTLISVSSSNMKAASGATVSRFAQLLERPSDGTTLIVTATVSEGRAGPQVSSLTVGSHTIMAMYSGDSNNTTSTSTAITQVITGTTNVVISAASGTLSHIDILPVTLQ